MFPINTTYFELPKILLFGVRVVTCLVLQQPIVYIAESAIISGITGTSFDGAENTAAIASGISLINVAAGSSILLRVGKDSPPPIQIEQYSWYKWFFARILCYLWRKESSWSYMSCRSLLRWYFCVCCKRCNCISKYISSAKKLLYYKCRYI